VTFTKVLVIDHIKLTPPPLAVWLFENDSAELLCVVSEFSQRHGQTYFVAVRIY
jgi:hypothetical protein